ncbi:MAG: sugar phosphate isomerase/epimerase [Dysgonamonadaceae bacterium]|nr:sugar phosphate isomerase/epimerase [Dysgonamonadaceae bacterium]MDD3727663.1 sugar phosphate isomerase/epimerase [Dysgonamonadaceae bacterium]MDD4606511.1 sugar phosphate isomerase/epimerase [Dysgonamonadaceae bacterium]
MKKISLFTWILGSMLLLSSCTQSKENKEAEVDKVSKNISIQLYSVREDIQRDFKGTIAKVAEAGYKGVEAANYNDGKFYGLTPEEFKNEIEAVGMEVISSHTGRPLEEKIADTNWDEVWAWWDTAIDAHKRADMKYIVAPWMPTPTTLSDLKEYCDYYNQIGEKCNAAGMKFGYHNHAFEYEEIDGEIMYDYMLENTDPDKVFFEMDVYWTTQGGYNPIDYFNKYPNRFKLLHIKDEKELGGDDSVMDMDNLFQNIDKSGVEHIIVEVEHYNFEPLESIKMSIDYLLNNENVKADYSK